MAFVIVISVIVSIIQSCHSIVDAQIQCQNGITIERGVSQQDQYKILNSHNYYRNLIASGRVPGQPKATNMQTMIWDPELAEAAQNIAETCVFEHVPVTDSRFKVGQNLYTWTSTAYESGFDWYTGIEAWFNEYMSYTYGTTIYNHYTQVVWADTNSVGCGCTHFRKSDGTYQKLYVCNYGPAGNWVGATPYATG